MNKTYYKQVLPGVLTFFVVNEETRNIEGMIREYKSNNMISIASNINTGLWEDVDNNYLAKSLINASTKIPQEEYDAAVFVANAMIETDYWYLSEDKVLKAVNPFVKEKKEVVAETVIC